MSQNNVKPLGREEYLSRVSKRVVNLDDGSAVCIRSLPASFIVSGADDPKAFESANLLVKSLCDADGKLLFTPEETDKAMTIDHIGLKVIMEAIMDLNGLKAPSSAEEETDAPEKN